MSESEERFRNNIKIEDEEMEEEASDEDDEDESTEDKSQNIPRAHLPDQPLEEGEELVMDEQAYLVYHQVNNTYINSWRAYSLGGRGELK